MKPISFTCERILEVPRSRIFEKIQDLDTWDSFTGYGILPGVREANYESRKNGMEGAVIKAFNTDGSQHKEKILTWHPPDLIKVKLYHFHRPLSALATHFIETWSFYKVGDQQIARRRMQLHPTSPFSKPLLWLISILLRKAIERHLEYIAGYKE